MLSPEVWRRPLCLTRFLHHARRVRDLTVPDTPGCNTERSPYFISRDWWRVLRSVFRRAGVPVLPNLRSLYWYDYDNPREIVLFLGPSLRFLEIVNFSIDHKHIVKAVKAVRRHIPRLVQFKLCLQAFHRPIYSPPLMRSIAKTLLSLDHLTTVNIPGPLPMDALRHLSSLPAVTNLTTGLGEVDFERFPGGAGVILPFASLSCLSINTTIENLNSLLSFFKAIHPARLLDLCVYLGRRYDADGIELGLQPISQDLSELFSLLSKFCTLHSLAIRTILRIPLPVGIEPAFPINDDGISPLLAIKHLRHLDLAHITPIELSPDFFPRAAKSWQSLQYFALGVYDVRWFTMAVEDLVPFATHCLKLHTLGIPLSYSLGGKPEQPMPTPQMTLKHIDHAWVEDSQVDAVAVVLARIFPRVQVEYTPHFLIPRSSERLNDLKDAYVRELEAQAGLSEQPGGGP